MHLISLYLRCKDLEAKDLPRLRHNLVDGLLRMVKEAVEHCVSLQQPHNATIVTQIYASIANILVHLVCLLFNILIQIMKSSPNIHLTYALFNILFPLSTT